MNDNINAFTLLPTYVRTCVSHPGESVLVAAVIVQCVEKEGNGGHE